MAIGGGAIVNQDILDVASRMHDVAGQEIFEKTRPGFFDVFTEIIPTGSEQNEVNLLDAAPVVREWKGPKLFQAMRAYEHTVKVTAKEVSFRMNFLKVRLDQTGLIGQRLGYFYSPRGPGGQFYDKLATDKLIENPIGYDKVPLFDEAHPHGPFGGVQSNVTRSPLSFATHNAVKVAFASRRFENGEPMHASADVMMVGPFNEQLGKEITQSANRILPVDITGVESVADIVAAATVPNVFSGGDMILVVNPRLTGDEAEHVYYFDGGMPAKAILCYESRRPEPHSQVAMDDEGRFMNNELRFSLEADQGYGAGFWQQAHALLPS